MGYSESERVNAGDRSTAEVADKRWGDEGMKVGIILAESPLLYSMPYRGSPRGVSSLGNCASADASLRITNVDRLVKRGRLGELAHHQPTNEITHMKVTRWSSPTHIPQYLDTPSPSPAECLGSPYLSLPSTFSDAGCARRPSSALLSI